MIAMREIFSTQDGSHSLYSHQFRDTYHSRYGAIQESKHVFIQAGLFYKLPCAKTLHILEMGFGTGLNAYLTFLESASRDIRVLYDTIEAFPVSQEEAGQLNYPAILSASQTEAVFFKMHSLSWGEPHQLSPQFTFRKWQEDLLAFHLPESVDLIYFDAFSPETQPELWEPPVWEKLFKALNQEGILVTYCAKGIVKRHLRNAGFKVESLPGPPGKREMTRATKP